MKQNYEKKYKEALDRASHIKDYNTIGTPQEIAELIFPELRENLKENRGNSSKIPSNSPKQELEQDKYKGLGNGTWNEGYFPTAIEKPKELEQAAAKWSMNNQEGFCTHSMKIAAFKAGAEWQKEQDEDGKALLYVNDHAYKKGFKDGKIEAMLNIELTWQDVKTIVNIADSKLTHTAWDDINYPDEQKYYEEVLKEYNEQKQK